MELTFVHQYGDGVPKRKRLAKACNVCRARKKRCIHVTGPTERDHDSPDEVVPVESTHQDQVQDSRPVSSKENAKRRFLSDLAPESTFVPRAQSRPENDSRPQNENIGVWVDKLEWDALIRQRNKESSRQENISRQNQRPHGAALGPLIDIYFQYVHPLLPLLDEAQFRRDHADGLVPEPLVHALCLVAAKHGEAEPHLRLTESTKTLAPREFCSRMHATVMASLRTPCSFEKISLIRILALTSMHSEGPDGTEEASMCLTQAMHYIQTLGWHLGQQHGVTSGDDLTTKRLFWCLWSLDRVHSCIYGRPIMMSDVDIAIEPFEPGESGFPAFEVWLYVAKLLNKVIGFYRPGYAITSTGWEEEFPSFEEPVDQARAWDLPQSTLSTLHLFYLMVAILSHRSRGVKYLPRNSPSYVRQSLSALELNRLLTSELFSSLHPMPIIPYATSLALSVAYQHLRQSQLQHQQENARQDFRSSFRILQRLRRTWSSTDVIATISKTVLEKLDKANDLSALRVDREAEPHSPGICPASMDKPHTLIDQRTPVRKTVTTETPARDSALGQDVSAAELAMQSGSGLFSDMDDIFGTYLDPQYAANFEDFAYVDDIASFDWDAVQA